MKKKKGCSEYTPYQNLRLEIVKEPPIKESPQITSSRAVLNLLSKEARKKDRECFWTVLLNGKNRVIGVNLVSMGSVNTSVVHPREVFKAAILANAVSVIAVHNHPSGDPTPSREDKEITRRLWDVGNILSISLHDHIIIGDKGYFSFADEYMLLGESDRNPDSVNSNMKRESDYKTKEDINNAYFNLQALELAIEGIGHENRCGSMPDSLIYGVKKIVQDTADILKPHISFFCTECKNIFVPCECPKEKEAVLPAGE